MNLLAFHALRAKDTNRHATGRDGTISALVVKSVNLLGATTWLAVELVDDDVKIFCVAR